MANLKVIVTSAYTQEVSASLLKAEVKYFIRKPYSVGDLRDFNPVSVGSAALRTRYGEIADAATWVIGEAA
jgi:hypothetical protein